MSRCFVERFVVAALIFPAGFCGGYAVRQIGS